MRRALVFALALLATLSLACGGDDDDPAPTSAPATQAAATAVPTPTQIGGSMILATTTSTQDSGLLDALVPLFKQQTGVDVKVIAVGTGAALEMGAKGDADAVLVHAPASEKKYVDSGDLVEGKLVMHNDFIIVGPKTDPAKAKGLADLKGVLTAIAATGPFISRGDNSGTHTKELDLWKTAAIDSKTAVRQREETGQGMGATLQVASQKQAYVLTDRATFLAQGKNLDLQIIFQGEKSLLNIYHVYLVSPEKHPAVKKVQGLAFVNFMIAPATQKVIGEFGKEKYGEALFFPDAGKSEDSLGR
jgi:tungstate transport system substrate-binding protein